MQVIETQNEGLKRQFKVTVAAADINKRLDSRLTELSRNLRLPGFRPGKVPASLMRQRYGNAVYKEVLEDMARDSTDELLRERNLRPSAQPLVSASTIEQNGDFVYDLSVEILPEIKMIDLAKLELTRETAEVSDADIDSGIADFAARFPKFTDAEDGHKAALGDRVIIDFIGKKDGTPFDGGAADDFALQLGAGQFIPGFEDGLVGAKKSDKRELKLKFPDDYQAKHLAGQDTEFSVTIKKIEVKTNEAPEELATRMGLESVEKLREQFKELLQREFDAQSRTKLKINLLDQLNEQRDFALPVSMIGHEFNTIWMQLFEGAPPSPPPPLPSLSDEEGEKPEDHEYMSVAQQREYRRIAERRVRVGLILAEIARLNNITVSDGEMRHAMRDAANNYPGQEKRVLDYFYKNQAAQERLRGPILEEKIVDFIVQLAKIKAVTVTREELFKVVDEVTPLTAQASETAKKSTAKTTKKAAKSEGESAKPEGDAEQPAKKPRKKPASE